MLRRGWPLDSPSTALEQPFDKLRVTNGETWMTVRQPFRQMVRGGWSCHNPSTALGQPFDKLRVTRRKRGGKCTAEVFKDGVSADRNTTDYKKQTITVSPSDKLTVHLASGGGWVARLNKVN
jgi:hypothetical protein